MIRILALCLLSASAAAAPSQQPPVDEKKLYPLGPESQRQEGVPKGTVTKWSWKSNVFARTERDCWTYVPAQYDKEKPAAVMVFQDGGGYQNENGGYRVPVVFDNLIHKKKMPVTIGIFIQPGTFPPEKEGEKGKSNRSFEYDTLSDQYARMIVDEILPEVGKSYNLSKDPKDRAIGGASSGGICAFTVAWERPDQFRKVLSGIGTYVDLAGGHVYPEKVMASERKPIRIFMIDGRNDNRGLNADGQYDPKRDWFYQNVRLKDALVAKGYDVNYAWGMGIHSHDMGGAMLPEMMRWLWRDHPVSVDPNDTTERSFRSGRSAAPPAAPPPGANPGPR